MANDTALTAQIARTALQDRSWMKHPHFLNGIPEDQAASRLQVVPAPTASIFSSVRVFVVTDPTEKPGTRSLIIAIAGDNRPQRIRTVDDFQQLLIENNLTVRSKQEALKTAEFYVKLLGTPYPQYGDKLKILHSARDISSKHGETLPEAVLVAIQPPMVHEEAFGFVAKLATWNEIGGELKTVELRFEREGRIVVETLHLAESVGKAWLPK